MTAATDTLPRPVRVPAEPATAHAHDHAQREPAPYANPYLAGLGLGLVLLAAFFVMGRGLGASGAFSSAVAATVQAVDAEHANNNPFYAEYIGEGSPLRSWLVFEVIGVLAGGFLSGILAGRVRRTVEKGPHISVRGRFLLAFCGGGLMGIGAKLARGCTSGQALTGGAQLAVGSWAFMLSVFAGAYALAWFVRRQWR